MTQKFFAHGKLLLSAEYSVLNGAKAIAVPTIAGQSLEVGPGKTSSHWQAKDHEGKVWLDFNIEEAYNADEKAVRDILYDLAGDKLLNNFQFKTELEFPREWGLGSSSTFISLIARWAGIDVWPAFFQHLKGSGYDVAVAETGENLQYQLNEKREPSWEFVSLPSFFQDTLLIYLGQKQNSAKEVVRFNQLNIHPQQIERISNLSEDLLYLDDKRSLQDWMNMHEALTSELIHKSPLKILRFPTLEGSIKSLGAWGGDFAWYCGPLEAKFFHELGYSQVFKFYDLVKRIEANN